MKISRMIYKGIRKIVKSCYPKMKVEGTANLPDEAAIIVGNHCQLHGPLAAELYFPGERYIWCAGQMMHLKDVPAYAYQDFWSGKPKGIRWVYKILSYLIAPLSVCIFNNAHTIGVYHDARIISTFKTTIKKLQEGANIIIFPEHREEHNHIVSGFQDRFIDIAKLYYKRTGKALQFVPMYVAPSLRKMYLGKPIRFCAENSMEEERKRICDYLMEEITEIACALPRHRVVPYENVSKKYHKFNVQEEK